MNAPATSPADAVPVRLFAERLHRLAARAALTRRLTAPDAVRRRARDLRRAAAQRDLLRTLAAAGPRA